jgi:tetratricopeptide (TPR) repeat protein
MSQPALAPLLQPYSPLAFQMRRVTGAVVGRPVELAAIQQELQSARTGRLAAVTVEGEPGIGKTRLLLATSEIAAAQGLTTIAVAADEEIRGPFLLARSILGSPEAAAAVAGTPAKESLQRSLDTLSGKDDPGLETLPPDQKLMRTLDLAAIALRDLAALRPMALLIDDLQWADDDSVRLLRYVVRAGGASPIFIMLAIRPEELAFVNEAVNMVADMERLGLVRRLKLNRFTQVETAELLRQVLGGRVDPTSAAAMHAQAEGVPFIVEELAHAYRDAAMVQEIDGSWTLAKNAERLIPSAVRTLISRRAARVPEETKEALAEAAILGRHFSLKDLQALQVQLGEGEPTPEALDQTLAPAVRAGLLVQHTQDSPADYAFAHDQVRDFATAGLTPTRKRAIHQAIVDLLMVGEPAPESLPLLAYHARAAGDATVCVRFSLQAIENALAASAPEEVLRVVELALPAAGTPQDRVKLLRARDQALDMLRRSNDRLEGLAELAALAEALGDPSLETEVQLRRAAAFRLSGEFDQAAALAQRVRERAAGKGDRAHELAACLELGQDLLHMDLGDGYSLATPEEFDSSGAEEAYGRAAELAEEVGDRPSLAAALRELGVIDFSKVRAYFVERFKAGDQHQILQRVTEGDTLPQILGDTPVAPLAGQAMARFERALELYEALGDRRGTMSAIIAMAYSSWGPDIHFGRGAGRHIEEIRRLASRWDTMTRESERALAEAQMLYGAHVFSRAKVVPDLAVSRGEEAYRKARVIGDRALEFLAAGGTALAHLDLGDVEGAKQWLDRAAAAAAESPTSFRARMLETWRGLWRGAIGDADEMRAPGPGGAAGHRAGPARRAVRGPGAARLGGGSPGRGAQGRRPVERGREGGRRGHGTDAAAAGPPSLGRPGGLGPGPGGPGPGRRGPSGGGGPLGIWGARLRIPRGRAPRGPHPDGGRVPRRRYGGGAADDPRLREGDACPVRPTDRGRGRPGSVAPRARGQGTGQAGGSDERPRRRPRQRRRARGTGRRSPRPPGGGPDQPGDRRPPGSRRRGGRPAAR